MVSGVTIDATSRSTFRPRDLPFDREAPTFVVGEPNPLTLELVLQDPVFLLDVSDHVLLLPVDPARERHEKELPWLKYVHERDSTPLKRERINRDKASGYVSFEFLDTMGSDQNIWQCHS